MNGLIYLKVKVKHLAAEARIIRHEEASLRGMSKWSLQHHRKTTVRDAARTAQMAYALLRNKTFLSTMPGCTPSSADIQEVKRLAKKFGSFDNHSEVVEEWFCVDG